MKRIGQPEVMFESIFEQHFNWNDSNNCSPDMIIEND